MDQREFFVYVLMPSGNHGEYTRKSEADHVYTNIIKPAVELALGEETKIKREVDTASPGAITSNIIRRIAKADVVIVDITGRNPNVFLELGIRHALKNRVTVIIHQQETIIPFDIAGFRSIEYDSFQMEGSKSAIADSIKAGVTSPASDSVVHEVYRNLEVHLNDGFDPREGVMPWESYWAHFKSITGKLLEAFVEGRYAPDIIIGITNGGALFADLISRQVPYKCPIASLWANRSSDPDTVFPHEINKMLCKAIEKTWGTGAKILLVDDLISTTFTYTLAIRFLRESLTGCDIRFLPLCYKEQKVYDLIRDVILWNDQSARFGLDDNAIADLHLVSWQRFPYEKDIKGS